MRVETLVGPVMDTGCTSSCLLAPPANVKFRIERSCAFRPNRAAALHECDVVHLWRAFRSSRVAGRDDWHEMHTTAPPPSMPQLTFGGVTKPTALTPGSRAAAPAGVDCGPWPNARSKRSSRSYRSYSPPRWPVP